jgi:hypothetical protein
MTDDLFVYPSPLHTAHSQQSEVALVQGSSRLLQRLMQDPCDAGIPLEKIEGFSFTMRENCRFRVNDVVYALQMPSGSRLIAAVACLATS